MTTGRWKLGLFLALMTSLMWGVLPIALKILLEAMDPYAITWFRFLVAALLLGGYLVLRGHLPGPAFLQRKVALLLLVAVVGLCGNYVLYLVALRYVFPGTAQMVIQLAPMFLLLGGLVVFREEFRRIQWAGFGMLLIGLVLFFNNRVAELNRLSGAYFLGVLIIVIAAVFWAAYALAQKQLLVVYDSEQILLLLYVAAVFLLFPAVEVRQVVGLDSLQWALLIFCCVNTLVAYGAFAEALAHWEASRVSAVLAVTPLFTLAAMWGMGRWWPGIEIREPMNGLSLFGAGLVVFGSMATALGRRRRRARGPSAVASPE